MQAEVSIPQLITNPRSTARDTEYVLKEPVLPEGYSVGYSDFVDAEMVIPERQLQQYARKGYVAVDGGGSEYTICSYDRARGEYVDATVTVPEGHLRVIYTGSRTKVE